MTREEEIKDAGYSWWKNSEFINGYIDSSDVYELGAKWADEHPKNPWISVEDSLPNIEEQVFVAYKDNSKLGMGCISHRIDKSKKMVVNHPELFNKIMDKNGFNGYQKEVVAWMPIPPLPKEGGEK